MNALAAAAVARQKRERQIELLKERLHTTISTVIDEWPEGERKPAPPNMKAAEIVHKYNMHYLSSNENGLKLVVLAESHGATPLCVQGSDLGHGVVDEELMALISKHFHGHLNVVHALPYGEPWILPKKQYAALNRGEKASLSRGTIEFWKVLGTMDGLLAKTSDGVDPCNDLSTYNEVFSCLEGGKKNMAENKLRLQRKAQILDSLFEKRMALVDTCPCPIYAGANNTIQVPNKTTGKLYSTPDRKLNAKEKAHVVRTCWNEYTSHYLDMALAQGASLVLLGKTLEPAIGKENLHEFMAKRGGTYRGALVHPSFNGARGKLGIPLFRELRDRIDRGMASFPAVAAPTCDGNTDSGHESQSDKFSRIGTEDEDANSAASDGKAELESGDEFSCTDTGENEKVSSFPVATAATDADALNGSTETGNEKQRDEVSRKDVEDDDDSRGKGALAGEEVLETKESFSIPDYEPKNECSWSRMYDEMYDSEDADKSLDDSIAALARGCSIEMENEQNCDSDDTSKMLEEMGMSREEMSWMLDDELM